MFINCVPVNAKDIPREEITDYKVSFYAFEPFNMQDENGKRFGYGYDMLQQVTHYMPVTFSYVGYDKTAKECEEMLRNGEIDIYTAARMNEKRKQEFIFSKPPAITSYTCMNVKVGNTKIVPGDYTIIIDSGSFNVTTSGGSEQATMKQEESFGYMWNPVEEGEEDSTSKKDMKSGGFFVINSGDFTMDCYDDALHSNSTLMIQDGTFTVKTGDDAIHADTDRTIYSGSYDISYCYGGFEGLTVTFYDGTYSITSNDDGVNAVGNGTTLITVEGGMFTIVSDGDSLDSNGDIVIKGGTLNLTCNGNGNTAIDVDGSYTCNGGTVITNDGSENGSGRMGPGGKRDNRSQDKMEYKEYA